MKNVLEITEKDVKKLFIEQRYEKLDVSDFKSQNKYEKLFDIDTISWPNIYKLPFDILCENKVIDLQYRIVHRYIGTQHLLFKIGKSNSPNCESCMMYPETIEHLFFECFIVKNFWFKLIELYSCFINLEISLSCKDVILMYDNGNEFVSTNINTLILYGKSFIYNCKMKNRNVNIDSFAKYVYPKLCVIDHVNTKNKECLALLKVFIESI